MAKKDCAFQFATSYRWANTDFYEDTPLITLEEAKALWNKHLPQFIKDLQTEGARPEMALWINMDGIGDYHTTLLHADQSTETDGERLFVTERRYLEA